MFNHLLSRLYLWYSLFRNLSSKRNLRFFLCYLNLFIVYSVGSFWIFSNSRDRLWRLRGFCCAILGDFLLGIFNLSHIYLHFTFLFDLWFLFIRSFILRLRRGFPATLLAFDRWAIRGVFVLEALIWALFWWWLVTFWTHFLPSLSIILLSFYFLD